jgi:hypothetical protein
MRRNTHESRPCGGERPPTILALAALLVAVLAACDGDRAAGPREPTALDVSGTYFGLETLQPTGCTPALAPADAPQLIVNQSGTLVTASGLGGAGTATLNGTVTGGGDMTLVGVTTLPVQRGAVNSSVTVRMTYRPAADGARLRGAAQVSQEERDIATNVLLRTCSWEGTTDLARRTAPVPEVAPRACAEEPGLRAQPAGDRELLVVRNASARPVTLHWRNAQGVRVRLGALNAGYEVGVPSSIGDPYVVTDEAGQCVGVLVVSGSGPAVATLR